jgi:hypothetical protein
VTAHTVSSVELPEWVNSSVADRAGVAAVVFVLGAMIWAFSAVISALTYANGGWKARVSDLAGPWFIVGILLVLAMVLLSLRSSSGSTALGPIADYPTVIVRAVLAMAAVGLFVTGLDALAALAEMLDDFGGGLSSLIDDVAMLLFVVAAGLMAMTASRSADKS